LVSSLSDLGKDSLKREEMNKNLLKSDRLLGFSLKYRWLFFKNDFAHSISFEFDIDRMIGFGRDIEY
jgi:hypothetical protein